MSSPSLFDLLQPIWNALLREMAIELACGGDIDVYAYTLTERLDRQQADEAERLRRPPPLPLDPRFLQVAAARLAKAAPKTWRFDVYARLQGQREWAVVAHRLPAESVLDIAEVRVNQGVEVTLCEAGTVHALSPLTVMRLDLGEAVPAAALPARWLAERARHAPPPPVSGRRAVSTDPAPPVIVPAGSGSVEVYLATPASPIGRP